MANLYDKASFILTANAYSSSKLFSVKPSNGTGDLTFTRASSGSRINSSGLIELVGNNVPRLTYSGSSCPQFLFEPQRTNFILKSEDLPSIYTTTANVSSELISGPYGATISSSKITLSGSTNQGDFHVSNIMTVSQSIYTYSIWVKGINGETLNVGLNSSSPPYENSYTRVTFNGQWQRISGSYTAASTITEFHIRNNFPSPVTNATVFNVWAPQIELGNYPTSYIPTTTATVTRVQDTSQTTGLSSLIGQREGTLFVDYTPTFLAVNNANSGPGILKINNTINGTLTIAQNYNDYIQAIVYSGSAVPVVSLLSDTKVNLSSSYKIAFAYSSSNSKLYINGIQNGTSTAIYNTFNTTLDSLNLTDSGFSANVNQNLCKTVAIYKTRLSDSELIALTT